MPGIAVPPPHSFIHHRQAWHLKAATITVQHYLLDAETSLCLTPVRQLVSESHFEHRVASASRIGLFIGVSLSCCSCCGWYMAAKLVELSGMSTAVAECLVVVATTTAGCPCGWSSDGSHHYHHRGLWLYRLLVTVQAPFAEPWGGGGGAMGAMGRRRGAGLLLLLSGAQAHVSLLWPPGPASPVLHSPHPQQPY